MKHRKGDRVTHYGFPATIVDIREIEDEPIVVLQYDDGKRMSHRAEDIEATR